MWKRLCCLITACLLSVSLTACGDPENPAASSAGTAAAAVSAVTETTQTTEAAPSTEPTEVRYPLRFVSAGETVRLEAVEVADYSVTDSVPAADSVADVPSVRGYLPYLYDSSLFRFAFDDDRVPVYEKYWYFRDGKPVVSGAPGVTPDDDGEYLLFIDFLFADSGKITARRAAVNITLTKDSDYDIYAAAKVPRDGLTPKAPLSEEYAAWLEKRNDDVFDAGTGDPEEAVRVWLGNQCADELASDDPFYQLDGLKILDVELCGKSYIDLYNIFIVRYSFAVKPSSQSYHMLQYPMDTNHWGTGELEGWLLSEGQEYLKYCGDGVWCRFDHVIWPDYQSDCGLTACASGRLPSETVWPENPDVPAYRDPSAPWEESWKLLEDPRKYDLRDPLNLWDQPWTLLEDPDRLDWAEIRAVSGAEYCRYLFDLVRANAFHSLPNRQSLYGGILGEQKSFPQSMRTTAVMLAANSICPEIAGGYADLLRELRSIDPDGFSYALTQVSVNRAEQVLAMIGGTSSPEIAQADAYFASLESPCEVCAVEYADGSVFYLSKRTADEPLYRRIDRYDSAAGMFSGCEIPEGFAQYRINSGTSASVLVLPGFGEPDTAFPKLRDVLFEANTVYVTERDYFASPEDDGYCLYSPADESGAVIPDWARSNQLTDLSGTYDGVCLLTTRPLGYMGAGSSEVRTGVTTEYSRMRNTMTICISRIDADLNVLAKMAAGVRNVFVKSVSVAPYRAGVAVTLELTEYAQSYTLAARHVYSPEHEPDGQPEATYIEMRFSQDPGSIAGDSGTAE